MLKGKKYADEFFHVDICNREEVLRIASLKEPDAVVSIASEVSLDATSYVVSQLGLKGYKYDLIDIAHDKHKYYELFRTNCINVPVTYVYNDASLIKKLDNSKHYFIKPSKGSGSRGVKQTNDIHGFDFEFYKNNYVHHDEKILIQEQVTGKEMTIDGFILENQFNLLAVSEEINDKQKGHTFSSELVFPPEWLTRKHISLIKSFSSSIVNSLGYIDAGPIHMEMIITPDDDLFLIDFSLRGGGFDVFTKIIEKTSGVDVLGRYFDSISGEKIMIPEVEEFKPVTLSFLYPANQGRITKIKGKELEGMHTNHYLKFIYNEGDHICLPESGRERIAYFITWGTDQKSVIKLRDELRRSISAIVENERI
jgi:biotin carboxylase